MADNTAAAKKKVDGHRGHIKTHIAKYQRYTDPHDKATMVKQIQNAQTQIRDLRSKHPSISAASEDTWRP